jgi:hypothetical protein
MINSIVLEPGQHLTPGIRAATAALGRFVGADEVVYPRSVGAMSRRAPYSA